MKQTLSALILSGLLLVYGSCKKDNLDTSSPSIPKRYAPIARAGNDTTIYLPFNSAVLDAWASSDPDSNIVSYAWRQIAGPSFTLDTSVLKVERFWISGLTTLGTYAFELTVTDAGSLSSKDTVSITMAEPVCTGTNQEVILKDLQWEYPMFMEIDVYNFFSYLPPNSHLKNIYIKRDAATTWEKVVPLFSDPATYGKAPEWGYGNGVLSISPGKDTTNDTPDIKIEYCN